jgi:hypothetical protein
MKLRHECASQPETSGRVKVRNSVRQSLSIHTFSQLMFPTKKFVPQTRGSQTNLLLPPPQKNLWVCCICVNRMLCRPCALFTHCLFTYTRIFILFYLQYFIISKLCMCITLFIYTSKNILLITGSIFSVFRGADAHFIVFEYPVAVWWVIMEVHLLPQNQECYALRAPNKSPDWNQIQPEYIWERQ